MLKRIKQPTINYKVAIISAVIINIPVYLLYGFTKMSLTMPSIVGLGIALITALFLLLVSFWYLKRFSSGFNVRNGFLLGLTLAFITFVLDLFFFGFLFGYGEWFLEWYVYIVYVEMIAIPTIVGNIYDRHRDSSLRSE